MSSVGEFAITANGHITMRLREHEGMRRVLQRLDGESRGWYSLIVWSLPKGGAIDDDRVSDYYDDADTYIQAAGSADRLTVEARWGDVHVVVGRAPVTGSRSETIRWDRFSVDVHPEEVLTAEEAYPLFVSFVERLELPPGTPTRPVEL